MRSLSTWVLSLLCLLLQACNSDDSGSAPGDGAQIFIVSPADGSTVRTLPAKLQVQVRNADPRALRARLSGVDISASFGAADAEGTRTAVVAMPALHVGRNQLQVSAGSAQADASFMVDLNGLGATSGAAMPLLVPIRTRVLCAGCDGSSETHYNVVLYADPADPYNATVYAAPALPAGATPNEGFQVLYLNRIDLSVVSNISIANPATSRWQDSALIAALAKVPAGCGNPAPGCLLVVQSLGRIGYTPCFVIGSPEDCSLSAQALQDAGASGRMAYANGTNPQVAYSFVGNISAGSGGGPDPVPAGTYHERLHCAGSNSGSGPACDALGAPGLSSTAPSGAAPQQIGAISGALVRDNFYNYSFVQSAPPLQFSSVYDSDNISHGFTINGNTIWSGFARGWPQQGGVHVVVVDGTDPSTVIENRWFPADRCASQLYGADGQSGAGGLIERYDSQAYLVFFAAFGDTSYTPNSGACTDASGNNVPNYSRASSARFAGLMDRLGGTWQVWFLTNFPNTDYPGNGSLPNFKDDYTLVGAFRHTAFTGLQDLRGAELSSVISRETSRYPRPSRIEGVLAMNNQGHYRPQQATHNMGLFSPNQMPVAGASRLNPVRWPMPGTTDPVAAYQWISSRLCCSDIRAAYVNQNVSPEIWLTQLLQLLYQDSGPQPAFSGADFVAMQQQLATEFLYLSSVRRLQANMFQLYEQRQAAVPLLLIQAQDEVLRNLQIDLNTTVSPPKWASITNSVLGVLGSVATIAGIAGVEGGGPVIATGIKTALSLAQLGVTVAAGETGKSAGTSLKAEENLEAAAGQLAAKVVDSYSTNLGQLANQFDRIVSDWGRLKAVGAPLAAGLMPWDNNASFLLMQAYDRAIRREFYTALLQANTQITVYEQAAAGPRNNNTYYGLDNPTVCRYDRTTVNPYWGLTTTGSGSARQQLPILFYPSGEPDTIARENLSYPYDYSWSVWALVLGTHGSDLCPLSHAQPNTFGLFDPLDPDDPSTLGAYRLWWFTRNPGFRVVVPKDIDHGGQWASCDRSSTTEFSC